MKGIKNGVIHIHSWHSLKDSAQTMKSLVARCGELGARGIVLTDHGTLTGFKEFVDTVNTYNEKNNTNMKAIPGCEVYFEEDDNDVTKRKHLVLIPTDIVGFRALCKIVTASNARLDSRKFPRVDTHLLMKYAGPGTSGHGHIIASSACMQGVLCMVLRENDYINKQLAGAKTKINMLTSPNDKKYKNNVSLFDSLSNEIIALKTERTEAQKLAKKPFKAKEKGVESHKDSPEYAELRRALDEEIQASKDAADDVVRLKSEIAKKEAQLKVLRQKIKDAEEDHEKWSELNALISSLESRRLSDDELFEKAKAEALRFEEIFGKGNFYCEVQNHRIKEEIKLFPMIAKLAKELNLPLVATNDAHMTYNNAEELKKRQITRSLRFNEWEYMDESEKEMYIKDDTELSSILLEILDEETVNKAMAGIGDIIDRCNVEIKKENHYPKFVSDIPGETASACLKRLARKGIAWRYNEGEWTKEHEERLNYELEVIEKLDVCDYLCIVEDFLRYGRLLGRIDIQDERFLKDPYNKELLEELASGEVGLGIGPGRGSAVGSLVCYLIGITGIDPMKYNLIFERFLNTERVTMPDIDSDFRPDIRNLVLNYVKHKYGEEAVCCIMTRMKQAAKAAIRNCARLLGSEKHDDITVYYRLADQICKVIPNSVGTTLSDCWDLLMMEFKDNADALEIINNAKLVEGGISSIGMHAAAVIISDNGDVSEYLPLLYNEKKEQWTTQVDKEEVESLGLLKMDFLGLRNLGIISNTLKTIKQRTGQCIDIEKVPFEPEVFENIFATGNTNSVFQFESSGMKQMLRQFKPTNIEDIILLVAAYRPGPMQYLDDIIAVKHGLKKPTYVIPEMASILGTTYGYPVYQEQIMTIFNKFAGFSLGESDIIRRYMSKKKTDKFAAYKDKFIDGLIANGADPYEADQFWRQLLAFSEYAFNKSHAAAYAFVAYYTAYLKHFYPTEYMCAVLNDSKFEKFGGLINDCKNFNISVKQPNINESANEFSVSADGSSILYGLGLVKSVGKSADMIYEERINNGKFTSFADFMLRTRCNKTAAEKLIEAGAFDEFTKSRKALFMAVPYYCDIVKKIQDKKNILKNPEKSEKSKENAQKAIITLTEDIYGLLYDAGGEEDTVERLRNEKNSTGAYISGHPLNSYPKSQEVGATNIDNLVADKTFTVFGIIKDLRETNRKSDGAKMAFFTIEDLSGEIEVKCFAPTYAKFGTLINEDAVVKIIGRVDEEEDAFNSSAEDEDEEEKTKLTLTAKEIHIIEAVKNPICIKVKHLIEWADCQNALMGYRDNNGHVLYVFDEMSGKIRKSNIKVSKEILKSKRFNIFEI